MSKVALAPGETLADYAFRVTDERDEARALAGRLAMENDGLVAPEELRQWKEAHDRALALLRECRPWVTAGLRTVTYFTPAEQALVARLDEVLK